MTLKDTKASLQESHGLCQTVTQETVHDRVGHKISILKAHMLCSVQDEFLPSSLWGFFNFMTRRLLFVSI